MLENEKPECVEDSSESSASVTASISRLLKRHLESFGAVQRERVGTTRLVNNFDVLSVEFRSSVYVNFLVFHQVLAKVDLFVLFIVRRVILDGS